MAKSVNQFLNKVMPKKNKIKFLFIFFVAVPLFLLVNTAQSITISPVILELGGSPGQTLKQGFKLLNETDKPANFYLSAMNFKQKEGAEGEPQFFEAEPGEESLAKWINFSKDPIFLKPGEVKQLEFTINIPPYAPAGGHFGALFAGNTPSDITGSGVGVSAKVGMLILLRVEGKIVEQGKLLEFKLKDGKRVYNSLPVNFLYKFENSGNVHLKPSGFIEIRNIFGGLAESLVVNKNQSNVLPSSVRTFESEWLKKIYNEPPKSFFEKVSYQKNNFALGRYTAKLNLRFGKNGQVALGEVSFWVLPWQLIFVYLVIAAIIVSALFILIRQYNKFIISRAMKNKSGR